LLSSDWSVDELQVDSANNLTCAMSAKGTSADYHFEREIRLPGNSAVVEFKYRLRNDGEQALPCFWCAHPLLAIEQDAVINIAGNMPLRVEDAETRAIVANDAEQRWPTLLMHDGEAIDLSQSFAANGTARSSASKIFVRTPASGSAGVVLKNGESITFRFDADELPWLGLWINNGAWSGCGSEPYTNLGIEPATSPYDCINEAVENEAVAWLQPGEERRWSLSVEIVS
jgi:galactose mutarotase-like enzyme